MIIIYTKKCIVNYLIFTYTRYNNKTIIVIYFLFFNIKPCVTVADIITYIV